MGRQTNADWWPAVSQDNCFCLCTWLWEAQDAWLAFHLEKTTECTYLEYSITKTSGGYRDTSVSA